jgi:predicted transcriptional regulator
MKHPLPVTELMARYNNSFTWIQARVVWTEVSKTPCASVRELATRSGVGYSQVAAILRYLRDLGYIVFDDRTERGRRVRVPFVDRTRDMQ